MRTLPTIPENLPRSTTASISSLSTEQRKGAAAVGVSDMKLEGTMVGPQSSSIVAEETMKTERGKTETSSSPDSTQGKVSDDQGGEEVIGSLKRMNHDLEMQKAKLKEEWELLRSQLDPSCPDTIEENRSEEVETPVIDSREDMDASQDKFQATAGPASCPKDRENESSQTSPAEEAKPNQSGITSWEISGGGYDVKPSATKELYEANKKFLELGGDLATAVGHVDVREAENKELQGTASQFNDSLQHYAAKQQRTMDCLKSQLTEAEIREGLMRKEVEVAKNTTELAKYNYEKSEQRNKEMANLLEVQQKDILAATVRNATLEDQNGELREVNRVQGEMNSLLSQMRDAMQGKVDEQQNALATFEGQLKESWAREGSLSADLATATTEVVSVKKNLKEMGEKNKGLEKTLREEKKSTERAKRNLETANSRIKSLEEEVKQLQSTVARLEEIEHQYLTDKQQACNLMSFFSPDSAASSSNRAITGPDFSFCHSFMERTEKALNGTGKAITGPEETADS